LNAANEEKAAIAAAKNKCIFMIFILELYQIKPAAQPPPLRGIVLFQHKGRLRLEAALPFYLSLTLTR
jgi:hypothetical protein